MIRDIIQCNDRLDGKFFQSLQNEKTIYSHVSNLPKLNRNCDYSDKTLIVRDGDIPTNESIFNTFNFKRVYCQNISCKQTDRIKCIPIGMESSDYTRPNGWDKFDVIKEIRTKDIKSENLLYANFSLCTNIRQRVLCLEYFKSKSYLTMKIQNQLKHPSVLKQEEYRIFCEDVLKHQFILCPEGNGIDTHRLWETLYLGRIPVVLHNTVNDSFQDLPILILDKWDDFENKQQQFLKERIDNHEYSLEKLSYYYWRKEISNG